MTTLRFTGTRRQAFTVQGPVNGDKFYYVDPGEVGGNVVEMDAADARALMERDPGLWERVKSVAPTVTDADAPAPRGGKDKKE